MAIHRGVIEGYAWPHGRLGYAPERVNRGRIGVYRFNKLLRSVLPMFENGEAGIWAWLVCNGSFKAYACANAGAMI